MIPSPCLNGLFHMDTEVSQSAGEGGMVIVAFLCMMMDS